MRSLAERIMTETYLDRYGQEHVPDPQAVRKQRRGAFAACVTSDNYILLTWPTWAPDVAELPGGGIDPGESEEEAMLREIYEETGVEFPSVLPCKEFRQTVLTYAGDKHEFWDYDQVFWLLKGDAIDNAYFEGDQTPPDGLKARWVKVEDLSMNMSIHAVHRKALKEILE